MSIPRIDINCKSKLLNGEIDRGLECNLHRQLNEVLMHGYVFGKENPLIWKYCKIYNANTELSYVCLAMYETLS